MTAVTLYYASFDPPSASIAELVEEAEKKDDKLKISCVDVGDMDDDEADSLLEKVKKNSCGDNNDAEFPIFVLKFFKNLPFFSFV